MNQGNANIDNLRDTLKHVYGEETYRPDISIMNDDEVVELVMPKSICRSGCAHPANQSVGVRRPARISRDVSSVLDAVHERDNDFAAAHADAVVLKAGIQRSLAERDVSPNSLSQSSSSHEDPRATVNGDAASQSSLASWVRAAGGDDCFVPGTLFQSVGGLFVPG